MSEDELRHSLGLAGYTTGKGKGNPDSNIRPIEVYMCSVVSNACTVGVGCRAVPRLTAFETLFSMRCQPFSVCVPCVAHRTLPLSLMAYCVPHHRSPCRRSAWATATASGGCPSTSSNGLVPPLPSSSFSAAVSSSGSMHLGGRRPHGN